MPLYDWRCPACHAPREVLRAVEDCMAPETCACGQWMVRELTPLHVMPDLAPYRAVAGDRAGEMITSRKDHREFLRRNNFSEVGNEMPKDTKKMRSTTKKGEIREELRRVVPSVLRKHNRKSA